MARRSRGLFLLLSLGFAASGCERTAPEQAAGPGVRSPAPSQAAPAPEKKEAIQPEVVPGPSQAGGKVVPAGGPPAERNGPEPPRTPEAAADQATEERPPLPPPRERLLLLLPSRPLIVDFVLTIDGQPYAQTLATTVSAALAWMDTDGDGTATWEEVAASPLFTSGELGNVPVRDLAEQRRFIQLYDDNRDGIANPDEVPRFLTRNSGGSRPFYFTCSNEFRRLNRTHSPVRRWLDEDRDGVIGPGEIAAAHDRLRLRDADIDEILLPADFQDTAEMDTNYLSNRRRTGEIDGGFLLGERAKWREIMYSLREQYALGAPLERSCLAAAPRLFAALDADQNGELDSQELPDLNEVEPDLVFAARFGSEEAMQQDERLQLVEVAPEWEGQVIHRHANRIAVQLPDAKLEFFVNDLVAMDVAPQVKEQFARADADNNAYLDEQEFTPQVFGMTPPFSALDRDSDGKLTEVELLSYRRQTLAAARSQIRSRQADAEDALFTALDTDSDGRLKSRELQLAPLRLQQLDLDQDGQVASTEIPASMLVGLVRGEGQMEASLFIPPPAAAGAADPEIPDWFRAMDHNGDGEISRLEFLGNAETFQQLDANGDDYLSPREASPREAR